MDVSRYLQRLNFTGPTPPTADTLRELQLAHLQTVPFENLSIHSGEAIVLGEAPLFEKIVERRRGGFCYELNGLFASLLRELGFEVVMLSAQVANDKGDFGPDFDHMTLLVTMPGKPEQRWLADVGFGDSFNEPLLLDVREAQDQGSRSYRIDETETHLLLWQRENGGEWKPQYRFTMTPYEFADYDPMCKYHQTSPDSHFTKARVCTRLTPGGRITLSAMRLITTKNGVREERMLADDDAYQQALNDNFGINMSISKAKVRTPD